MSNIDEVISRSRQKGEFSERKSFSVARERAIEKMRQFALADPHYYVLELIQAAIANQATHVDLQIGAKDFVLSYIGGGFDELELSHIFDFLFAAKSEVSTGAMRQLALGINALMLFEPAQIILESGDGTMPGTTRVEIDQRQSTVNLGTPEAPLNGTFLRATGLKRAKISKKSGLRGADYGPPECSAIEARCLSAPVPILVNGRSLFGFSSVRTPKLIGFDRVVHFDEGDLYGTLGTARQRHNQHFKLLTWGAWIQSLEYPLSEGERFGGIVTFNKLNKTADHAAVVRDERLEELWARLRPYMRQALSSDGAARSFEVRTLAGESLTQPQLRELVETHPALITVGQDIRPGGDEEATAIDISEALDAPVLRVSDEDFEIFCGFADISTHVLRPDLAGYDDLRILNGEPAPPPARPWILSEVAGAEIEVEDLLKHIAQLDAENPLVEVDREKLAEQLGSKKAVLKSTIYTPQRLPIDPEAAGVGVWARVRILEYVVWEGFIMAPYPGHVLDIEVPGRTTSALLAQSPVDAARPLAYTLARLMVALSAERLEDTSLRAIEQLDFAQIRPETSSAYIALAAIARRSILELSASKTQKNTPQLRFSVPDDAVTRALLDAPLFESVAGKTLSFRDLEALMKHTTGLVYGCVPQVEPALEGLDRERILKLDFQSEALLANIVGYGAYIRVDSRDILASSGEGKWLLRDLAAGLRAYPDAALLVEGPGAALGEALSETTIAELVGELLQTRNLNPDTARSRAAAIEARRQASRHLQYFICRRRATRPDLPTYGIERLPLFVDERRRHVSLEQIMAGFKAGSILMLDGRAAENSGYAARSSDEDTPRALMLDPWSYHLLSQLGSLAPAVDVGGEEEEEFKRSSEDIERSSLLKRQVNTELLSGQIGLPAEPQRSPAIRVVSASRTRAFMLRELALDFGVSGALTLKYSPGDAEIDLSLVNDQLRQSCVQLLYDALDQTMRETDALAVEQFKRALLDFAARRVQLADTGRGPLELRIIGTRDERALVRQILSTPFFPASRGAPVSAERLIQQACLERYRGEKLLPSSRLELADALSEEDRVWLEQISELPAVLTRARALKPKLEHVPAPESQEGSVAARLESLLATLRPDSHAKKPTAKRPNRAEGPPRKLAKEHSHTRVLYYAHPRDQLPRDEREWQIRRAFQKLDPDTPFTYVDGPNSYLLINQDHWLIKDAEGASPEDQTPMAWLLLGAYAHINEILEPVTNQHELEFQARVLDALADKKIV